MNYALLKHIHVAAVLVSATLFVLRGFWMLTDSPRLRDRWARVVPHVNDTVLLAAGFAMAWMARLQLAANPWLVAKLVGLAIYIVLGSIALKRGRSRAVRTVAFVAALAVLAAIVASALTKRVAGF